jgi:hypothetical protein
VINVVLRTGVGADPIGGSILPICGTIKPVDVVLLQELPVKLAGSAGGVKTKVTEPTVSRRIFCCVEVPGEDIPEGPAREGASCWLAMPTVVFTAETSAVVTNASAMVMKNPVSVNSAM